VRSIALCNATAVERSDHVRTQVQSTRISHVALAGPIVHRFNLAPWAVMCVRPHIVRSNAHAVERSAYSRTHVARQHACDRTRSAMIERMHHCVRTQRTPDLAARFILSINRTSCIFVFFTLGRRLGCVFGALCGPEPPRSSL
jgi:hypothetical protein